jgi:hypothetical protein
MGCLCFVSVQLLHLDQSDWDDLQIRNKVHQKRLNFLLEPYKTRCV